MRRRKLLALVVALVVVGGSYLFIAHGRGIWVPLWLRVVGERSVPDVLARYGPAARARMKPYFDRARMPYPPQRVSILVFKRERRVAVWASDGNQWRFIRDYPILAGSGHAGPKLREGDQQVPEGLYRVAGLNPNSSYHLSILVDYPNAFDRQMALREKRTRLGGDIFIHGKAASIGCVAIGDVAIEDVFTLVAEAGPRNVRLTFAPNDLRVAGAPLREDAPAWVAQLYRTIAAALADFPLWMESNSAIEIRGMHKEEKVLLAR